MLVDYLFELCLLYLVYLLDCWLWLKLFSFVVFLLDSVGVVVLV